MKQQYIYESYRYRSEWRVRRTPCRRVTTPDGRTVSEPTGKSEIVETGLDRIRAIFMVARLYEKQDLSV